MTITAHRSRRQAPITDGYGSEEFRSMDATLIEAHARADFRLAQEASLERIRLLQECAEFLQRPGGVPETRQVPAVVLMPQPTQRAGGPLPPSRVTTLPFHSAPYAGSNLSFQRTFDHGSERTFVSARHDGSRRSANEIAAQYSNVDLATGELAAMLLVGESDASVYDYPPVASSRVPGVLEATSQRVLVENWIHPGPHAPAYDIGAVATIALPSRAQAFVDPTRDGMYGGLVTALGDVTFELYAFLPSGREVYERRTARFLNATASSYGTSGQTRFSAPVSLGVELQVPAQAVAIVMRVTLTLWAIRALTADGASPSGGLVGAILADAAVDPAHGIATVQHPGRARVLLSSVVSHG